VRRAWPALGRRVNEKEKVCEKVRSFQIASAWPTSKPALAVNRKLLSRQTVSVNGDEVK